ncbi:MAG TPA: 16S rRNA (cytosine(967)-C(5))-methyltransferase RsmB [Steroidobacteraceae bacterium]|jgi:16S rRNA (cytosine967-C5)-methyltransferase|nr:16S rRNA (cytosine(967)-C(5))-methyltransferase RsmB [Steroidobacteraceae bacterium]
MKTTAASARSLAAYAVARILREGVTLDAALKDALVAANPQLGRTVRSLSYGAVRGYYRHEAILSRLLSAPVRSLDLLVRALLSVALFELEDERTPEYAVVDAAVDTAKITDAARAGGLINAVLRRYLRERASLDADIARNPASRHASPVWLADRLRADWPVRWTQLLAAGDAQAPMWLRVNGRRSTTDAYLDTLRAAGIGARAEPRVPQAVLLDAPCDVQDLPGFAQGLVSVQDLGAQCVAFPLGLVAGQRVLDACAAPGGKTALIAEREPDLDKLVAVDIDPQRLVRVRENLARGNLRADVISGDAGEPAAWWDGAPFDRILLDAPCSALGVIRRHPDIRLRKSPSDIDKLPPLQRRLLDSAWTMLKAGGRLVYATCTLTRSENRDLIGAFLRSTEGAASVPAEAWAGWPNFGEADDFGRQILPGEAGADGFYYAALTKQ